MTVPVKGGRPHKLTKEVQDGIVRLILRGNFRTPSAAVFGVDDETLRRWMRKGEAILAARAKAEAEGTEYAEEVRADGVDLAAFAAAIHRAEAEAETGLVDKIRLRGETDDPQLLKWLAERRFRKHWAPTDKVEVSGPDGGPIEVADARERLMGKLAKLEARGGAQGVPGDPDGSGGREP